MKLSGDVAEPGFRYDTTTIVFHWLTVALVVLLWTSAQTIDFFPRGDGRVPMRSMHILMGVLLICVVAARLAWRASGGRRRPSPPDLLDLGAHLVHYLLYVMLVAAVLLGLANVWVRGDVFFFLFQVPAYDPGNTALRHLVEDLHAYATNGIVLVAGVHAVAALFHHYVLHDSILRRMLPH